MVHIRPNMTAISLKNDSQMNTLKRQRPSGQLHTQLYVAYKKFTSNIKHIAIKGKYTMLTLITTKQKYLYQFQ